MTAVLHHALFGGLPGQPDADVDGMHAAVLRFVREQDGAIESAGKQQEMSTVTAIRYIPGTSADTLRPMYSVTKKIDFCYGHRLLDYDGICKHPHGHNATAEIEVRTGTLDNRNMVCDFSDIKRIVKGWIDRELDHKMICATTIRW